MKPSKSDFNWYHTVERLKANDMKDFDIAKLMKIPIDYVRMVQKVTNNVQSKRISFLARDFDLTENEIETIGSYHKGGIDLEMPHQTADGLSFHERYRRMLTGLERNKL